MNFYIQKNLLYNITTTPIFLVTDGLESGKIKSSNFGEDQRW